MRAFVSGTGTGVGKTHLTRALALALRRRGEPVVAIKPIETGCVHGPEDALALATACARPELALVPGFHRSTRSVAPLAAAMAGDAPLDWAALLTAIEPHLGAQNLLVEGAGGLLVPLDAERTIAELAQAFGLPVIVVARDALGVLSDTLATVECAERRGLRVAAVILAATRSPDSSTATNVDILGARIEPPVVRFPWVESEAELAAAGDVILATLSRTRPDP